MYDIILKNGMIYDGTGNVAYKGDIAIKNDKIIKISNEIADNTGERVIDVSGLAICPGFIDMHSHSDASFLRDNRCESKLYQGVTSELMGQCGITMYPCKDDKIEELCLFTGKDVKYDKQYYTSKSLEEYINKVNTNNKKMSTNLLPLVGNCALRAGTIGFDSKKADKKEIDDMIQLLDADMKYGAWGLSLGLGYTPGLFADQQELNALGSVIQKYEGVITSHLRNQSDHIFDALDEMYEIYRQTGARVHIAHLKICGKEQLGTSDKVIENIKKAEASGIKVTKDMYPFDAAETGITDILPRWTLEGGVKAASQRLLNGSPDRNKIIKLLEEDFKTKKDGESVYINNTYGMYPESENMNIYQLSKKIGLSMAEALAEVIVKTGGNTNCIYFILDEEDVFNYLKENDVAIGSDGYGYSFDEEFKPHPRSFGTFPKFLRLAREKKFCSLETAIYRVTKLTANIIGIKNRGVLKEGYVADITVIDPVNVRDTATYENPCSKPEGIKHVIINGEFAIFEGEQTNKRLGKFILKNKE